MMLKSRLVKILKWNTDPACTLRTDWTIGDEVQIATHCAIFSREGGVAGKVQIGDGTHIGDHSIIDCAANVIIGKEVAIGPNCVLYSHDHDYTSESSAAWKGGLICKDIMIEDGAWVGSGVTILPGVTIGKRAVIAAGAVSQKTCPLTPFGAASPPSKSEKQEKHDAIHLRTDER